MSWICSTALPCEDCELGHHDHCLGPEIIADSGVRIYKHCNCLRQVHYSKAVGHG